MRRSVLALLAICFVGLGFSQKYEYSFKVKGAENDTVYLANYFGSKLFYSDTAYSDAKGSFTFKGEDLLRGKYAVVCPGPKWFEILIDEPKFEIQTDTTDWVANMKIKNSPNNQIYYDYVKFISNQRKEMDALNKELEKHAQDSVLSNELSKKILAINQSVQNRQNEIVADHSDLLVGKMMNINIPIEVPDAPTDEKGNVTDQYFQYNFYKNHFFDHCDLNDNALGRLPDFDRKMDEFFNKVVVQVPDSAKKEADKLIAQIEDKKGELFKYTINWLTVFFEKHKIMCMDAGFVHMIEKYYMSDMAFWVDSAALSKVTERALLMKPTICGVKAPYMKLQDTTGVKSYNLYDLNSDYTVIYIWDPDCGHCKKSNPKLVDFYTEYKEKGVEVYSVGNPFETEKWIEYLNENPDFARMINVSDSPQKPSSFRTFYDVHTTPRILVLDKDKKIIAKQIEIEQLGEIIDHHLKTQESIN
ncbi:MAG: thioredoxin-like domain-containing protein [Bacteroidota bacterium]